MANGIQPSSIEDFITRRWLLMIQYLLFRKSVMDMVRISYGIKYFSRKNGKIILELKLLLCLIVV